MNNIVLVGFSQSGKSTIGKLLAEKTQQGFLELEEELQKEFQKTLRELRQEMDEDAFREMEKDFLERWMCKKNKVIAVSSDSFIDEEIASIFPKIGTVIYLQTDSGELKRRLEEGRTEERMEVAAVEEAEILEQIAKYEPYFFKVAGMIIQTAGKTPEEIVNEIQLLI